MKNTLTIFRSGVVCLCGLRGFGLMAAIVLGLQAFSGTYLALFFQPAPEMAWHSIEFIEDNIALGEFCRSSHRWGAFLVMLFLMLHMFFGLVRGLYRPPYTLVWLSGLPLLLLTAGMVLTGYLLPWDFRSYWAVLTMNNWLSDLPLFSGALRWFLLEDAPEGIVPISRWFFAHIALLPLAAGLILAGHCLLRHRARQQEAEEQAAKAVDKSRPDRAICPLAGCSRKMRIFFPLAGLVALLCFLAVFGTIRQEVADPITTSPVPQPDWLFLLFFQVSRYCQGDMAMIGVFWIPAGVIAALVLLPLLFRANSKDKPTGDTATLEPAEMPCRDLSANPCDEAGERRTSPAVRRSFQALIAIAALAGFVALMIVTDHSGSTTPVWSCGACHKQGFGKSFAEAPWKPADFSTHHDNAWLALHYRYPQYFWMMDAEVPKW